jgi:hypothetical protein
MVLSATDRSIERLAEAEPPKSLTSAERKDQLRELRHLVEQLEQGSASLNQRATTLAALGVAALGVFGAFATRLGGLHYEVLTILTAAALAIGSLALVRAALYALDSVRPGGDWSRNFADRARVSIETPTDDAAQATHLVEAIKVQLDRNRYKAATMRRANFYSSMALVAVTAAVLIVGVDAAAH